jgi:hypothetical protein
MGGFTMYSLNARPEIGSPAGQPPSQEGVYVGELNNGAVVEIDTAHSHYKLVKRDATHMSISGHPMYCPEPVEVEIEGSFGGSTPSMPNPGFIGRGMRMVFKHPHFDLVTTSRIREIHTH